MATKFWIFDLDNTLHNATPHIFPHINRSMTLYLQQHLQLDEASASELRMHYWRRYGATLSGLMRHHGTDPAHFLRHTHQFPDLPQMVLREPRLRHVLKNLPGRKVVFSNAPQHYALAVLKLLRVTDLFDDVMAVEHTRYHPKPESFGFMRLMKQHGVKAAQCVMVEDSLENLRTAKRLGDAHGMGEFRNARRAVCGRKNPRCDAIAACSIAAGLKFQKDFCHREHRVHREGSG